MPHGSYTIGELSKSVGVPVSTLRFYERAGLLIPEGRTRGNYRTYSKTSVDRLRFIRAAQDVGLTLEDIGQLLALRDDSSTACPEVQQLIESRLAEVERRITDFKQVHTDLQMLLNVCRNTEAAGRCAVIEGFSGRTPDGQEPA